MKIGKLGAVNSIRKDVDRRLERRFLIWLKDFDPLRMFDALVGVHLFDICTAWLVFHFHFNIFEALEINVFLRSALLHGYWPPWIMQEIFLFSAFILTTLVLLWSKKRTEKYTGRHRLTIIVMGFGLACLWGFPFAAATNLIRGLVPLLGGYPSIYTYLLWGIPFALIAMRYGAKIEDPRILASSVLPIIIVGLVIL